jgi:hypothetical protein
MVVLPEWSDGDEEMSGWLHVPAALPPGRNNGTLWIEERMGHRACLSGFEKKSVARPFQDRTPDLPTRILVTERCVVYRTPPRWQ